MDNKKSFSIKFWIGLGVVGLIILITLISAMTIVPAGSTGVVVTMGKVSDTTLPEGFHLKAPYVQHVYDMNNKIQKYETDADAVSKDLQSVSATIAINYRLASNSSAFIYKNVGKDYEGTLIAPAIQESLKGVTAHYTAEQLITNRAAVSEEVKTIVNDRLNEYGLYVEKYNIVNFSFSAAYDAAIEQKQIAEQNLLKTQTEQEEQIVIAEAEAKKKTIAAEAEAEKIRVEAEAQAEANREISESITSNYLIYKELEKWNGELPEVTGSDNGFIFDLSGLNKANINTEVVEDTE
jgi:regulator of protease activity HflC (stomatin/prohibitin superfamily)